MSGHSKWAQIKRQKGATDVKKGKAFTKLAKAIIIAVKQGGGIGDPDQNFRLRLAIDAAKTVNMPKENIERAIKRASGREAGDIVEVVYEGYASGGVAVIVEAATDNSTRTTAEVKNLFNKSGGNFGQQGSVDFLFKHMGQIIVKKNNKTFDDIFSDALENGAEDIEDAGDEVFIYTLIPDFAKVREKLIEKGLEIVESELVRVPISTIEISDPEKQNKIINFLNNLEELEDVQKVYSNLA